MDRQPLAEAGRGAAGHQDAPPNWQWVARSPFVYITRDLLFWGMGLSFGVLGWFGWAWSVCRILRNRLFATENLALIVWIGGYMLWMGRLWPMTMRYFLPLYGALAVMAGWCLYEMYCRARTSRASYSHASLLLVSFGLAFAAIGGFQVSHGVADATAISARSSWRLCCLSALFFHRRGSIARRFWRHSPSVSRSFGG